MMGNDFFWIALLWPHKLTPLQKYEAAVQHQIDHLVSKMDAHDDRDPRMVEMRLPSWITRNRGRLATRLVRLNRRFDTALEKAWAKTTTPG